MSAPHRVSLSNADTHTEVVFLLFQHTPFSKSAIVLPELVDREGKNVTPLPNDKP